MMLCRRVVIMLCLCDGVLHRTKCFRPDYRYTTALVGNRNADEVVVIDVTPAERRDEQRPLFYAALQRYAESCFTPITVGGGIRTIEEIRFLMAECCADKVVIGLVAAQATPGLADGVVQKFGAQALTIAMNHREPPDLLTTGKWSDIDSLDYSSVWCGEILLNSIPRDGSLLGYDLATLSQAVHCHPDIPVMVAGGCGTWAHMGAAFEAGASAACTSVIHHLTETSLAACKKWLVANCKQPVREAA